MKRAGFGFLWLILGIVTLGIVGSLAYNAGLTAGLAASASETAVAVVPAYGFGFGFGWIFFPILFLFLLFGLAFALSGRRRGWGHGGYGRGYGGWNGQGWDPKGVAPDDLPPPIRGTLERWHADAHQPARDAGQGSGSSAEPPGPTTGA
jgi:hypothetical protein